MSIPFPSVSSLLGVEIGACNTRTVLFDHAGGQFHYLAAASAPTSIIHPFRNINDGLLQALMDLQSVTSRSLLDDTSHLILPTLADGSGVDSLVVAFSAGNPLRILTVGLLQDFSARSAKRLASTIPGCKVAAVDLASKPRQVDQLDTIISNSPDIILFAGGTNHGSTQAIQKLAGVILQACRSFSGERIPTVIYAGNSILDEEFESQFQGEARFFAAPNIRPEVNQEDLAPAMDVLAQVVREKRILQFEGLQNLQKISSVPPIPSSYAFNRVIRYLSKRYPSSKGVLGVDLGASSTVVVTAENGDSEISTHGYGMGEGLRSFLEEHPIDQVTRWLPEQSAVDATPDYLWQKSLYPQTVPATIDTLDIEQAAAREIISAVMIDHLEQALLPAACFELILATGATLTRTPHPGDSLMMILDGIQPVGITSILLDKNGLSSLLGAAAPINSMIPVQVIDSSAYTNLATVICPVTKAKPGTPILRVSIDYGQSSVTRLDIKMGSLVAFPLPPGQTANILMEPARGVVIDPIRKANGFKVYGGLCGVVIDARGRPLSLPQNSELRKQTLQHWASVLGA
jgi:MutL protein